MAGIGLTGAAIALKQLSQVNSKARVIIPPLPSDAAMASGINPMAVLRDFDYGTIKQENGRQIREFRIIADNSTLQLNSAVTFNTWNFNNRVPGPTLRAKRRRSHSSSFPQPRRDIPLMHFHGFHRSEMDGVKPVRHGAATVMSLTRNLLGTFVPLSH
jgi:hypothetical protein